MLNKIRYFIAGRVLGILNPAKDGPLHEGRKIKYQGGETDELYNHDQ